MKKFKCNFLVQWISWHGSRGN